MAAKPTFLCQVTRTVGEDEQITVSFNGEDQGELRTRLGQASAVLDARMKKNNDKVLEVGEIARQQAEAVRTRIQREERLRLVNVGALSSAFLDPQAPEDDNGADAPAG